MLHVPRQVNGAATVEYHIKTEHVNLSAKHTEM